MALALALALGLRVTGLSLKPQGLWLALVSAALFGAVALVTAKRARGRASVTAAEAVARPRICAIP